MFDFATIKKGIYDWITSITGEEAILADQNAPKPDNSHFVYRINSVLQVGEDYLSPPDAAGMGTLYGNRDFTCQIQGFGPGIIQLTENLRTSLQRPDIIESLAEDKIVAFNYGTVDDITGLDESRYEERSSLDVFMRSEMVLENVEIGNIEIVNGTATWKQPGKADFDRNFEIDSQ